MHSSSVQPKVRGLNLRSKLTGSTLTTHLLRLCAAIELLMSPGLSELDKNFWSPAAN